MNAKGKRSVSVSYRIGAADTMHSDLVQSDDRASTLVDLMVLTVDADW